MLSEISQEHKYTISFYVKHKKLDLIELECRMVVTRCEGGWGQYGGKGEMLVKGYKIQIIEAIVQELLLYNTVTMADDMFLKNAYVCEVWVC
jgi:hypothetical protein